MIIFSMIFLRTILKLLGATTDSIMPYAVTYASIYIVSCIFNVFNVTMNNIVTSEGALTNYACFDGWCNIEYWFGPSFHLCIRYGSCRCSNRKLQFHRLFRL